MDPIFQTVAQTGSRAHTLPITLIHPTSSSSPPQTLPLDTLLQHLAHQTSSNPETPPTFSILDCTALIPSSSPSSSSAPTLYLTWLTRVSTPALFSLTCVSEHVRKQMVEGLKTVMSIFNDTGGMSEKGEAVAPGTYMVVLKRVDLDKMRCVPVGLASGEKRAIGEYVAGWKAPEGAGEE